MVRDTVAVETFASFATSLMFIGTETWKRYWISGRSAANENTQTCQRQNQALDYHHEYPYLSICSSAPDNLTLGEGEALQELGFDGRQTHILNLLTAGRRIQIFKRVLGDDFAAWIRKYQM